MRYYYKDFITKKRRYTAGKFVGWSGRTGLLNVHYAGFARQSDVVWIPEYLIEKETMAQLPAKETEPA